jgi:hypothetical protein
MITIKMISSSLFLGISVFFLASLPSLTLAAGASYEQVFKNKSSGGEELVKAFFDLLSDPGKTAEVVGAKATQAQPPNALVRPYLDPAFVLQRASGERYVAETYMPASVEKFAIGDVRTTQPAEGVIVVRYSVRATETTPDTALIMSKSKAPRLTVFHWNPAANRWQILSHANFNTPVAAICDKKPLTSNKIKSPSSPEDQLLGKELITKFYDLVMKGDSSPILNPQIQFQSAQGMGYTTLSERKKSTQYQRISFDSPIVTRNGRLLVVATFNTTEQRTLMQDNHLQADKAANLSTFIQSDSGQWSMIAVAAFAPAKALPDGVDCVPPGKLLNAP